MKFLKGEGELHNLELDETTLSELLELPPWIRLTKAVCNRISAKASYYVMSALFNFLTVTFRVHLTDCINDRNRQPGKSPLRGTERQT